MKITANMVTLSRLFLMPFPFAGILFGDEAARWICFVLLVLLGMTDFVDGMLARKYGPTKLGGLLDPAADKVFVAAGFLALAGAGWVPAWIIVLVLLREFLIGGLRSAVALRGESVTTSYWAKIKTEWQMVSLGIIFLLEMLPAVWQDVSILVLLAFFGGISLCYWLVLKKSPPEWAIPATYGFIFVTVTQIIWGSGVTIYASMFLILGVTWYSAADYIRHSRKIFKQTGMKGADWARIFWAFGFAFASYFVGGYVFAALPLLICFGFEFMLSGVDNVIAAEKRECANWPFVVTGTSAFIFVLASLVDVYSMFGMAHWVLAFVLAVISGIVFSAVMIKHGALFKKAIDFA